MNIDIAKLLESHRAHLLEVAADYVSEGDLAKTKFAMEVAHDRATTKTLLDLYRSGGAGNGLGLTPDPTEPSALAHDPRLKPSRRVKAGSKAAKARAIKAGETRRKNLADKAKAAAQVTLNQGTNSITTSHEGDAPALSPATHLALAKVEGETGGAA